MPVEADLAWAAGLFEGEGYLVRRAIGNRVYLGLGIEMRDLDVVTRFVQVLRASETTMTKRASGPKIDSQIRLRKRSDKNPKHSDIYVWTTVGLTAEHAYQLMRPQLGERRRMRGDAIVAEAKRVREALPTHGVCDECGRTFTFADYGRTRRYCSTLCYNRAKIKRPGQREASRERNRRYHARLLARSIHSGQQRIDQT